MLESVQHIRVPAVRSPKWNNYGYLDFLLIAAATEMGSECICVMSGLRSESGYKCLKDDPFHVLNRSARIVDLHISNLKRLLLPKPGEP